MLWRVDAGRATAVVERNWVGLGVVRSWGLRGSGIPTTPDREE